MKLVVKPVAAPAADPVGGDRRPGAARHWLRPIMT